MYISPNLKNLFENKDGKQIYFENNSELLLILTLYTQICTHLPVETTKTSFRI